MSSCMWGGIPIQTWMKEVNVEAETVQPRQHAFLSSPNEPSSPLSPTFLISAVCLNGSSVHKQTHTLTHSPHTPCSTCGKTPHYQTCSSGPELPAASSLLSDTFFVLFFRGWPLLVFLFVNGSFSLFYPVVVDDVFLFLWIIPHSKKLNCVSCRPSLTQLLFHSTLFRVWLLSECVCSVSVFFLPCVEQCVFCCCPSLWLSLLLLLWWSALQRGSCALRFASGSKWLWLSDPLR